VATEAPKATEDHLIGDFPLRWPISSNALRQKNIHKTELSQRLRVGSDAYGSYRYAQG